MSLAEAEERAGHDEEMRELRAALVRTQRQLSHAKARVDQLVEAAYTGARDALLTMGPLPPVAAPPKDRRTRKAEVALWHLTDWQGCKLTPSYDSDVMVRRVRQFVDKARRITAVQRADHPVRELVVALGGDMIEGLFNFPTQAHEIDATLFGQQDRVAALLAETVRAGLADHERVTVVGEWGNHGRLGSKRDAVPRSDNGDRMTYRLARAMLAGETRLTWDDSPEDIQHIEIGNYRALLIHGDEIGRNGFASPTTILGHVTRWQSGAHPWPFRDVYSGHYHSHLELPLPSGHGALYQTGSTESDNRYAGVMLAATSTPSQRLHFIDPDEGFVTASYKVLLD